MAKYDQHTELCSPLHDGKWSVPLAIAHNGNENDDTRVCASETCVYIGKRSLDLGARAFCPIVEVIHVQGCGWEDNWACVVKTLCCSSSQAPPGISQVYLHVIFMIQLGLGCDDPGLLEQPSPSWQQSGLSSWNFILSLGGSHKNCH